MTPKKPKTVCPACQSRRLTWQQVVAIHPVIWQVVCRDCGAAFERPAANSERKAHDA